ncbi:MAG TPA: hypothetical protein VGH38_16680 [Bryobacteraceae bacterium]
MAFGITICSQASGQSSQPTVLLIDVENHVEYQDDIADVTKFATIPSLTPAVNFRDFSVATVLADIVAINGQPAKGLYAARARSIITSPTPTAGNGAIADVARAAIREEIFEILNPDGSPVGTIVSLGLSGGAPPPGAPGTQGAADFAITGGTAAFVGMRGVSGSGPSPQTVAARAASMSEDPGSRRILGGGKTRRVLTLYPMFAPQILAVTHSSDFTAISAVKPASSGEILSVFASGLGPTKPGVDPGQPFPAASVSTVTSPVRVTVNGQAAEVTGAVGLAGTVGGYQVNFRLPDGTGSGTATIQLSAAWIAGASVPIAVQ